MKSSISAIAALAVLLPLAVSADQPIVDAAQDAAANAAGAASDAANAASDATAKLVEQAKKVAEGVPTNVSREPFKATSANAPFFEQFTSDWNKRWQVSAATKEQKEGEVFAYVGEWKVEEPTIYPGLIGDEGLVAKSKAAQHAISAAFDKPIDPKGKPLVVQYEVKLQNGLVCGGAYLKLLTESPEGIQAKEFSDKTPYTIMFGPDKCGATNKVHFIFRHKNPITGAIEEKHLANTPYPKISKTSSLYTLLVNPDQTFEIFINGDSKSKGSLLEDFEPAVNPEKEIDDPEDKKPADWVDLKRIPDPAATKPEDWDEDAPREIPDEEAVQPEGWLADEPATVPDPEAVKPSEWDDEEDGEWVAPLVPNPKCAEAPGCGEWKRPTIKNPAFKGKWQAPYLDNPDYKGEWAAKKIANPAYFEDKSPADFTPIGGVGFEIWTMDEDILFDNIYVGHDIEEAQRIQKETFDVKTRIEASTEKKEIEEQAKETAKEAVKKSGDLVGDVVARLKDFVAAAREDPVAAVKADTQVAGGLVVGLLGLFGTLGLVLGGGAAAAPQAKKLAKKVDAPKVAEQAKSSALKATEEVKKRATAVADKVQEK